MRKFLYALFSIIFFLFLLMGYQTFNNVSKEIFIYTFSLTGFLMCLFMLVAKGEKS